MARKKKISDTTKTYKATLFNFGRKFESNGSSVIGVLKGFNVRNIKGKSILAIETGEERKERVLSPVMTYRLFSSHGLIKEVALKNVSLLFDI